MSVSIDFSGYGFLYFVICCIYKCIVYSLFHCLTMYLFLTEIFHNLQENQLVFVVLVNDVVAVIVNILPPIFLPYKLIEMLFLI